MKTPIVVVAFGTTEEALATYTCLAGKISDLLPGEEIIWAFTANRGAAQPASAAHPSPPEVLAQLTGRGIKKVVIQTLHLLPFAIFCSLFMPL